jgi:hypothetical protein
MCACVPDRGQVYAENKGEVYDVTLTTVDVRYGTHGINNFYKMQVIHNKLKDLYILWTRYGLATPCSCRGWSCSSPSQLNDTRLSP